MMGNGLSSVEDGWGDFGLNIIPGGYYVLLEDAPTLLARQGRRFLLPASVFSVMILIPAV